MAVNVYHPSGAEAGKGVLGNRGYRMSQKKKKKIGGVYSLFIEQWICACLVSQRAHSNASSPDVKKEVVVASHL